MDVKSAALPDPAEVLERTEASLVDAVEKVRMARKALPASEPPGGETVAVATKAFREELARQFAPGEAPSMGREELREMARRAALVVTASAIWSGTLGPLLTSAEVRSLMGGVSRQRVDELNKDRKLIGLRDKSGKWRFPAFQFPEGRPLAPLVKAFWTLREAAVSDWSAASWCVAPDPALVGLSPLEWLRQGREADRIETVARQDAARLAR